MTEVIAEPQVERDAPRSVHLGAGRAAQLKPETRRLYAADWAAFALWCRTGDQTALPVEAATLAAYLQDQAVRLGPGALTRRLAAIAVPAHSICTRYVQCQRASWHWARTIRRRSPGSGSTGAPPKPCGMWLCSVRRRGERRRGGAGGAAAWEPRPLRPLAGIWPS